MSRPCYMGRLYLISQFCFMSLVLHRNTEEKSWMNMNDSGREMRCNKN